MSTYSSTHTYSHTNRPTHTRTRTQALTHTHTHARTRARSLSLSHRTDMPLLIWALTRACARSHFLSLYLSGVVYCCWCGLTCRWANMRVRALARSPCLFLRSDVPLLMRVLTDDTTSSSASSSSSATSPVIRPPVPSFNAPAPTCAPAPAPLTSASPISNVDAGKAHMCDITRPYV